MLKVICLDTRQYYNKRTSVIYTDFTKLCLDICADYTNLWDRLVRNYERGCRITIFDDIFWIEAIV